MSLNVNSLHEYFRQAIRLTDRAEQARFLDEVCTDAEQRQCLDQLLAADSTQNSNPLDHLADELQPHSARDTELLKQAALNPCEHDSPRSLPSPDDDELVETQIGPYRIREKIGEGGMGVVFLAEQIEPVRRKVALKIIKAGMSTKDVIGRFEAERQALAMMDHPNIARVFDGGTSRSPKSHSRSEQTGQPYFVMELVQGLPITDYCDEQQLTTEDRLKLFATVCLAVQHAHQKGIIHRDLKPSNIIVPEIDGVPVPKIIDFGIAKALNQSLGENTVYTQISQMVGTPLYMSPEQTSLGVVDVDTRSDVYSLGVLLYELLTGSTPFERKEFKEAGIDEMRRVIREDDPPRPSARVSTMNANALSTISQRRSSDPRKLKALFTGELDWLVMKSLEKDRNRRYESASALAADVQRYLTGSPIEACPPTVIYRMRKYIRRHRLAVLSTSAIVVAFVLGLAGMTWQALRATAEMHRADREAEAAKSEAEISRAVLSFVDADLLSRADPHTEPDPDLSVRSILDRAAQSIGQRFSEHPRVEATISATLGKAYHSLGDYQQAQRFYDRAYELQCSQLGANAAQSLETELQRCWLLHDLGKWAEARTKLEDLLAHCKRSLGDSHLVTQRTRTCLADVIRHLAEYHEAENMSRQALAINRKQLGDRHLETIRTTNILALCLNGQDRWKEGEELLRDNLSIATRTLGPSHPTTLAVKLNLANVLGALERREESVTLLRDIVSESRRVLGEDHPETLTAIENLATQLTGLGQYSEATRIQRDLLTACNEKLGMDHPTTRTVMVNLAISLAEQGDLAGAQELQESILALEYRIMGNDHPWTMSSLDNLRTTVVRRAFAAIQQKQYAEAERLVRQLFDTQKRLFDENHPSMDETRRLLGQFLAHLSWVRASDAIGTEDATLAVDLAREAEQFEPNQHTSLNALGTGLYRLGQYRESVEVFKKADDSADGCKCHRMTQAMAFWHLGHREEARRLLAEGIVWLDANREELANSNREDWINRIRAEAETLIGPTDKDTTDD